MRYALILICLCALLSHARTARHRTATDPAYSSALAAANRFLSAWQTRDHETGIMMLTDSARLSASRERLQGFFSPAPGAAFEIHHGARLRTGTYSFPTVLFGISEADPHAYTCRILVVKSGKEWVVGKLP